MALSSPFVDHPRVIGPASSIVLTLLLATACDNSTGPVSLPPTADFTFSETNLDVTFADASTDTDGTIASWSWTFGDGATSTSESPGHSFAAPGSYDVTLTVTDDDGLTDDVTKTVSVTAAPQAPTAGFTFSVNDLDITFTDASSDPDGTIASWSWTFGDGASSTLQNPSHTFAAPGSYDVTLTVTDNDGLTDDATKTVSVTSPQQEPEAVLVGAGDIARCSSSDDEDTAALLDGIPGTVFTTGDNAYPDGTASDFADCYDPSWGRHKSRTRPSPGNHDYHTSDASAYFDSFGALAGESRTGYYSYDLGSWHVISLNSEIDMSAGSPQEQWLRADLAASSSLCTIAYWHEPRFGSGDRHGSSSAPRPLWDALYEYGVEIVLNGHEHVYERFAPQAPDGTADPAHGIRQFIVGTGGAGLYGFDTPLPNSEARDDTSHGVLKLSLYADRYGWEFVPVAGDSYTDSGSGTCHTAGP
jgi:PKD repeat protein